MAMSVLESDWRARRDAVGGEAKAGSDADTGAPPGAHEAEPIEVGSSDRTSRVFGRWR
jgi:hypothetical protein